MVFPRALCVFGLRGHRIFIMSSLECPTCNHVNPDTDRFCGGCGLSLESHETIAALKFRDAIRTGVEREVTTNYGEREIVEWRLVTNVTERLVTWAKVFGAVVGFLLALLIGGLALLGYQSYADLQTKIRSATNDVEPILSEARKRAKAIAETSGNLREELDKQKTQLEAIKVINQEVLALSQKVARLEDSAFKTEGEVPREHIAKLQSALTSFRIYLAGLGYVATNRVTVSVGSDIENAYYDPSSGQITIGKLFMYDEDALFSTYFQRALVEIQGPWTLKSDEPAISQILQGLPEYFSCSYRGDPKVATHGGAEFQKSMGRPAGPLRNLETRQQFAAQLSDMDAQSGGEVWAATLWDLRKRLGQATVDRLAFDAWREIKPDDRGKLQSRFVFRLIEADRRLNAGENVAAIRRAFLDRRLPGNW
jgi:hypothetical protein